MRKTRFTGTKTNDSRSRVFAALVWNRRMSRSRLADELGLTRAAVGVIVEDLISRGLVRTGGTEASGGGRPSEILEVVPDAAVAIGTSMSDFSWSVVATNLEAEVLERRTIPMSGTGPEDAVEAVARGYEEITAALKDRFVVPAVGIGSPGLVDTHTGIIVRAVDVQWRDVAFGAMVEARIGVPVTVVNRSKVGALAEYWCARERGTVRDLVFVSIGTGIAAGIIQDGELILGANSSAGELGHLTVVPGGPVCGCGNRGCLQSVANEEAILRRALTLQARDDAGAPPYGTADDVIRAAEGGDAVARRVIAEVAEYVSVAIGGLVNLLNPEQVVLGGPIADAGSLLIDETRRRIANHCMRHNLETLVIRGSSFGSDSSAIGAAVLMIKQATEHLIA